MADNLNPESTRSGLEPWKDTEKLYDYDPETPRKAPGVFEDSADQPMAMESEVCFFKLIENF